MLIMISRKEAAVDMEGKKKTAIYLRISNEDAGSGEQEESFSITSQRKLLLEYIRKDDGLAGGEVLEFCDDGFTGSNMERPGMQELLKQVKKNRIGCILVKDISRFSRDYIETGTYLNEIFPFMGVDFIAVGDGYDSRTGGGSTIALDTAFQTLLYDLYSKDVSVKVKAFFDSKCADGEYVFGQVPFGYELSREVKHTVVVNEREAKVVRYIFSLAAGGMTSTQIAKRLFEEEIPTASQLRGRAGTKKNQTWSHAAVRSILGNRFYLGEMSYGKTVRQSVGSRRKAAIPESEWKVIKDHHEPLVTPEIFARVSLKALGHTTKRKRPKHPLVGKIYCGGCGYSASYKPEGNGKIPRHFWCRKHALLQIPDCCTYFNAAVLEELVLTMLNRELLKRGELAKQRGALEEFQNENLKKLERKVREYRKQYRDAGKKRDILYEDYAAGRMNAQEYRSRADQLTEQIGELTEKADKAEAEYSSLEEASEKAKEDMKQVIRFSHLEELTQEVVDVFIRRVNVYKGKRVEIEWNFSE